MPATDSHTLAQPLIVQLLVQKGRLDPSRLESLRESNAREKLPLEEALLRTSLASERDIAQAYSDYFLIPMLKDPAKTIHVAPEVVQRLPEKLCRDHLVAPVRVLDRTLHVAFFTPRELHIVDELQLLTGLAVRPLIAPLSVIEEILGLLYPESAWVGGEGSNGSTSFEEVAENEEADAAFTESTEEVVHLDQPPPPGRDGRIIRYVNQVLEQALRSGASDIHVEPFENRCRVRLRIDGNLNEIPPPRRRCSFRSSPASRSWRKWTSPRSASPRTGRSR